MGKQTNSKPPKEAVVKGGPMKSYGMGAPTHTVKPTPSKG